eukprot:TRINITY_DN3291_c0_g1_i1.p2 TRINITY_DN3291_c0_g1~~TRINITY_DN3291_c0_g1_i1.p2  ORF type:complete len:172 (-),score=25.77 TRINITY_DN3291_c0_g1_i1:13-528(-)
MYLEKQFLLLALGILPPRIGCKVNQPYIYHRGMLNGWTWFKAKDHSLGRTMSTAACSHDGAVYHVDGLPNYCSKMLRADITNNARAAFMFGNWDRIHDRFPTADVRGIMRIADAEFRACADTQQEWMQRAKNKHLVDIQRAVAVQRALCSQFALQPMPTPGNASEKGTDAS